jgi:hypothetical protein
VCWIIVLQGDETMTKQLNIRNDEAYARAKRLAERFGLSTTEVVLKALRHLDTDAVVLLPYESLPPEAKRDHEHFKELARKAREEAGPLATSDHSDFYDE